MDNKLKPVMSDEFTFVPQKAGIEIYVSLGILLIVAVALMAANTTIEGGFDIFWVIYPVVFAAALGFMFLRSVISRGCLSTKNTCESSPGRP